MSYSNPRTLITRLCSLSKHRFPSTPFPSWVTWPVPGALGLRGCQLREASVTPLASHAHLTPKHNQWPQRDVVWLSSWPHGSVTAGLLSGDPSSMFWTQSLCNPTPSQSLSLCPGRTSTGPRHRQSACRCCGPCTRKGLTVLAPQLSQTHLPSLQTSRHQKPGLRFANIGQMRSVQFILC